MQVRRLQPEAKLPIRGSAGAAGYDLTSVENTVVKGNSKALIKTGLAIRVPEGTYGRIAPRSGLAWKNHIDVGGGVIDSDFRGEVGIILFNHSDKDLTISAGDRVAQLILECIEIAAVEEVEVLDSTTRGSAGYGSTGIQAAQQL